MKTLDEVIEIMEGIDFISWGADALHYLKEYRERLSQLEDMMDRYDVNNRNYQEAVQNCEMVQLKYQQLLDDYNCNPALTWEQLKQMGGKPVWVETKTKGGRWMIFERIGSVYGLGDVAVFSCDVGITCYKKNCGKTWQAYRKERS